MRRLSKVFLISVIALGLSGIAAAQWRDDNDHDRDDQGWYGRDNGRAWQDGLSRGEQDRRENRRYNYRRGDWHHGDDAYRDAYRSGYNQGYYGGGYRNRGRGPYGYDQGAYQQGFQDGRSDGRHDSLAGHSYRPTHDSNYRHATRGYSSYYGDKDSYKQEYRSGYLRGYDLGYRNNSGYGGRGW